MWSITANDSIPEERCLRPEAAIQHFPVCWPFDNPQYLLLNLAIGGDMGGPVDNSIFPVHMEVDYVRVYQKH